MRIFPKPGLVSQVPTVTGKTLIWFMILPNPTSIIHPAKCESNINAPTLPWIICEQFVIHIIQASGTGSGAEQRFPRMSKVKAVSKIIKCYMLFIKQQGVDYRDRFWGLSDKPLQMKLIKNWSTTPGVAGLNCTLCKHQLSFLQNQHVFLNS